MGVFTPVLEVATLTLCDTRQTLALRGAVALALGCHDLPWHIGETLKQLAPELLRGLLVPPPLHQDGADVIVLIDCPLQVRPLTMAGEPYLIQGSLIARARPPPSPPIGIVLPNLPAPWPDGFVGHCDTTGEQSSATSRERKGKR